MATHKKPKNVAELTSFTVSALTDMRNNQIRVPEAKEIANLVGKTIGCVKTQLEFYKLCKKEPDKNTMEFVALG
jgi:hypothetical protein